MENKKVTLRKKRHQRIRLKMRGSASRPRLVVRRSLKNMHAQLVDDVAKISLFSLSTANKEVKQKIAYGGNVKAAVVLAELFSQQAKAKGFSEIIYDRAGYLYHGRIKAFADALRKGGLKF